MKRSNGNSNQERPQLFHRLKAALEEANEFLEGNLTLRNFEVPAAPPSLKSREIVNLRESLRMSQSVFAKVLNVSPKTVQAWERGTRRPAQSALRLLQILKTEPGIVARM